MQAEEKTGKTTTRNLVLRLKSRILGVTTPACRLSVIVYMHKGAC